MDASSWREHSSDTYKQIYDHPPTIAACSIQVSVIIHLAILALSISANAQQVGIRTSLDTVSGARISTGTGVSDIGTIRVMPASDSPAVSLSVSSIAIYNISASSLAVNVINSTVSLNALPSLVTGTAEIGNVKNSGTFAVQATQTGTWLINGSTSAVSVLSLPALPAGTNNIGIVVPSISSAAVYNFPGSVIAVGLSSGSSGTPLYTVWTATNPVYVINSTVSLNALPPLAAGTAEVGNVKNSGTFAVQAAQSGAWNLASSSVVARQDGVYTITPGTGIFTVGFASGSFSNPLYFLTTGTIIETPTISSLAVYNVAGAAVGIVSTQTFNVTFASGSFSNPFYTLSTGAVSVTGSSVTVFNSSTTPLAVALYGSSVAVYNVSGSTMAVVVSSANLTSINGNAIFTSPDGLNSLPTYNQAELDLLTQLLIQLQQINLRLFLMDVKMGPTAPIGGL